MGATELIIAIYVVGFSWWGYSAGSTRSTGTAAGLFLGLFLGIIGIVIIYASRKNTEQFYHQQESTADQLKKYKELLDSGAITEYEYNVQKAKLLE